MILLLLALGATPQMVSQQPHRAAPKQLVASPNGQLFVTLEPGAMGARIWDARTGLTLRHLSGEVAAAAFDPDGRTLWIARMTGIARMDIATGSEPVSNGKLGGWGSMRLVRGGAGLVVLTSLGVASLVTADIGGAFANRGGRSKSRRTARGSLPMAHTQQHAR